MLFWFSYSPLTLAYSCTFRENEYLVDSDRYAKCFSCDQIYTKFYIRYRLAHLHLTLTHFSGQVEGYFKGQSEADFDNEYFINDDRYSYMKNVQLPSNKKHYMSGIMIINIGQCYGNVYLDGKYLVIVDRYIWAFAIE